MGRPKKPATAEVLPPENGQQPPKAEKTASTAVSTKRETAAAKAGKAGEQPGSMLAAIARAAADPAVNVEKMVALHNLHKDIEADAARRSFDSAFAEMQEHLPVVTKRGTLEIRDKNDKLIQSSPYAKWDDIGRVIKPILSRFGFALWFKNGREADQVIVTAILSHRDGHREETTMRLALDNSGSKNNVQGIGSSTSYGKRYAAGSLLNLIFEDEDDDGAGAAPTAAERAEAHRQNTEQRLTGLADATDKKNEKPAEQKPKAGKAAAAAAPKAPNPGEEPEKFFDFIKPLVAEAKSKADLETLWTAHIAPVEGDFFEEDYKAVSKLFNDRADAVKPSKK